MFHPAHTLGTLTQYAVLTQLPIQQAVYVPPSHMHACCRSKAAPFLHLFLHTPGALSSSGYLLQLASPAAGLQAVATLLQAVIAISHNPCSHLASPGSEPSTIPATAASPSSPSCGPPSSGGGATDPPSSPSHSNSRSARRSRSCSSCVNSAFGCIAAAPGLVHELLLLLQDPRHAGNAVLLLDLLFPCLTPAQQLQLVQDSACIHSLVQLLEHTACVSSGEAVRAPVAAHLLLQIVRLHPAAALHPISTNTAAPHDDSDSAVGSEFSAPETLANRLLSAVRPGKAAVYAAQAVCAIASSAVCAAALGTISALHQLTKLLQEAQQESSWTSLHVDLATDYRTALSLIPGVVCQLALVLPQSAGGFIMLELQSPNAAHVLATALQLHHHTLPDAAIELALLWPALQQSLQPLGQQQEQWQCWQDKRDSERHSQDGQQRPASPGIDLQLCGADGPVDAVGDTVSLGPCVTWSQPLSSAAAEVEDTAGSQQPPAAASDNEGNNDAPSEGHSPGTHPSCRGMSTDSLSPDDEQRPEEYTQREVDAVVFAVLPDSARRLGSVLTDGVVAVPGTAAAADPSSEEDFGLHEPYWGRSPSRKSPTQAHQQQQQADSRTELGLHTWGSAVSARDREALNDDVPLPFAPSYSHAEQHMPSGATAGDVQHACNTGQMPALTASQAPASASAAPVATATAMEASSVQAAAMDISRPQAPSSPKRPAAFVPPQEPPAKQPTLSSTAGQQGASAAGAGEEPVAMSAQHHQQLEQPEVHSVGGDMSMRPLPKHYHAAKQQQQEERDMPVSQSPSAQVEGASQVQHQPAPEQPGDPAEQQPVGAEQDPAVSAQPSGGSKQQQQHPADSVTQIDSLSSDDDSGDSVSSGGSGGGSDSGGDSDGDGGGGGKKKKKKKGSLYMAVYEASHNGDVQQLLRELGFGTPDSPAMAMLQEGVKQGVLRYVEMHRRDKVPKPLKRMWRGPEGRFCVAARVAREAGEQGSAWGYGFGPTTQAAVLSAAEEAVGNMYVCGVSFERLPAYTGPGPQ